MLRTIPETPPQSIAPPTSSEAAVSIVIPCLNEEESVENLYERLADLIAGVAGYNFEFIVVDDGSSDNSVAKLMDVFESWTNFTLVEHGENRGVAAAIMTGISMAQTEIVASMDFDCTYDPIQFKNLLPLIQTADVVTASPYHPLGKVLNVPEWRLVVSKCASWAYRRVMVEKLYTYTSCFRVYRRSTVADIRLRNDGFVGVAELLWRVGRRGGRIVESPATLDVRQFGQSKLRVAEVTFRHFRFLSRAVIYRLFRRALPADSSANPRYPAISSERNAHV